MNLERAEETMIESRRLVKQVKAILDQGEAVICDTCGANRYTSPLGWSLYNSLKALDDRFGKILKRINYWQEQGHTTLPDSKEFDLPDLRKG